MEYSQTPQNSNFNWEKTCESFMDFLNELKEKILKNLEKLSSRNDRTLNKLIYELKESFETLSKTLKEIKFFEEEYYDFFSIERMAYYILDNNELFENISLIKTLITSFYQLIQKKTNLNHEEYLEEYKKFNSEIVAFEEFFYTKICEPSENYDEETLSKITNALIKL